MHSTVRMQAIKATRGTASGLIVHIEIECDHCGPCDLLFAGHHVRPIVEMLQSLMAREPELTDGGEVQTIAERTTEIHPEDN